MRLNERRAVAPAAAWLARAVFLLLVAIAAAVVPEAAPRLSARTPIVGIDIGTTNARVAVRHAGRIEIADNEHGARATPSVLAWAAGSWEPLVGEAALAVADPVSVVKLTDVQRLLGRSFDEFAREQQRDERTPLAVVERAGLPAVRVDMSGEHRLFSPEELCAFLLRALKRTAEAHIREPVDLAVVSVPAAFTDGQRSALREAARLADLRVYRIVNRPAAALHALGVSDEGGVHNVLVVHVGGATSEAAVLQSDDGVLEFIGNAHDDRLGGQDMDAHLLSHFATTARDRHNLTALDARAVSRLSREVERAKRALSVQYRAAVSAAPRRKGHAPRHTLALHA